jgi:DNA primase
VQRNTRPALRSRDLREQPDRGALAALLGRLRVNLTTAIRDTLARDLSVSPRSLDLLESGWLPSRRALAIPMRDPAGQVVGIRYRSSSGRKWAERGSRNRLFYAPSLLACQHPWLFVTEGATDTLAALSFGIRVIGVSSASASTDERSDLVDIVDGIGVRHVVLLLDPDSAGRQAAERITADLWPHVEIVRDVLVPGKDLRAWMATASRDEIRAHVRATSPVVVEVDA